MVFIRALIDIVYIISVYTSTLQLLELLEYQMSLLIECKVKNLRKKKGKINKRKTTPATMVGLHPQANERLPFDLSEGKVGGHKGW